MSILKNVGARLNGIILRNKVLNFFDSIIEKCINIFPSRLSRRYKSFIGNFLITNAKYLNIKKYTSKIKLANSIVDIGCAEGSLLFVLRSKHSNCKFYGCDSGYSSLYLNQNNLYPNLKFNDLDILHEHYSPDGSNRPEDVSLNLPSQVDIVVMYDVLPYLNLDTQKNYISQISSSLKIGGELILTAMLNTNSGVIIGGARGESYQYTTDIDIFLSLAKKHNLILIDSAMGNWDKTRARWDIRDIDLLVLKKI